MDIEIPPSISCISSQRALKLRNDGISPRTDSVQVWQVEAPGLYHSVPIPRLCVEDVTTGEGNALLFSKSRVCLIRSVGELE